MSRLKEQLEKGNPLEKLSRVKLANIVSKMEKFANKQFIKEIETLFNVLEPMREDGYDIIDSIHEVISDLNDSLGDIEMGATELKSLIRKKW